MLDDQLVFSSYAGTLGPDGSEANGMLTLTLAGGHRVLIYPSAEAPAGEPIPC